MFPIKGIRKYVTDKLEEITVLRKFRDSGGILIITETADDKDEDRKKVQDRELLNEVKVTKIPLENVWIFENEFEQQTFSEKLINDQKGAFTSAGKKVEKTILNKSLTQGSVLILDEPEVHLHPKWQLKYAQLIVSLVKGNNIRVLVNSHSPYMIEALKRYGTQAKIKMNFYLATQDWKQSTIKEVTTNISPIF